MKVLAKLFLLFTIVTAVELFLLLQFAQLTSWWVTVALIVVPGFVGAWLVRREGARALRAIRASLVGQQEPTSAILDGAFVLVAGALLLTPGVLTDLAGLSLLVPAFRRRVGAYAAVRVKKAVMDRLQSGDLRVVGLGSATNRGYEVIDSEDIT